MGFGALNLGSLLLGLIAWILPVIILMKLNIDHKKWILVSLASVTACAISLCMQIIYINHKVRVEDWSALMDTSDAVTFASALLLAVTIVLNAIMMTKYIKNR